MDKKNRDTSKHGVPGNKNAVKLRTPDLRKEAYKQYCDHIAEGYPKKCFVFEHPKLSITWETVDKYIAENPTEFPPLLIQLAHAKAYKKWFDKGGGLVVGKYKNGSPVTWSNIMRNMFRKDGWDETEVRQDNKSHVQQLASCIRSDEEPDSLKDSKESNSEI